MSVLGLAEFTIKTLHTEKRKSLNINEKILFRLFVININILNKLITYFIS